MKLTLPLLGLILCCLPVSACAQQTIFNVPSADVTPPGKVFVQHESQFRPWHGGGLQNRRFINSTEYTAIGIGHNTELDATLFNINAPSSDNITLGVGFKSALPLFAKRYSKREFKLTVGELIPISLQGSNGVGSWTYSHLSGRLPKLNTRITAGVSVGTKQIFGRNTVGFMGGLEQPLTKRISWINDWYSGSHGLGLLITGFSLALPANSALYAGYQIPNTRRSGAQGFVLELAKFF